MITGDLKSKVDAIWNAMWTGGLSNPQTVMEQLTLLLFLKGLDDAQTLAERQARARGAEIERNLFPDKLDEIPVVDDAGDFMSKTNKEMVELTRITSDETEPFRQFLKAQIERHVSLTGSAHATHLLADFDETLAKVWLVKPKRISIEDLVEDIPGQKREAVSA